MIEGEGTERETVRWMMNIGLRRRVVTRRVIYALNIKTEKNFLVSCLNQVKSFF